MKLTLFEVSPGAMVNFYSDNQIDFDFLSHEKVIRLMQCLQAGKWDKEVIENKVTYETEVNGIKIRLWRAEPPPNCKIIEVEEEVPARPAQVVKVKKLQCVEPSDSQK